MNITELGGTMPKIKFCDHSIRDNFYTRHKKNLEGKLLNYKSNAKNRADELNSKGIFLGLIDSVNKDCEGKGYYKYIGKLNGALNHPDIQSRTFCDSIREIIIQQAEPVRLADDNYYSGKTSFIKKKKQMVDAEKKPFYAVISLNKKRKDIKQEHIDEIYRIAEKFKTNQNWESIRLEAQVLALSCRCKTVYEKIKAVLEKYRVVDAPQSQPIAQVQSQPIVNTASHSAKGSTQPSSDESLKKTANSGGDIDCLINDILSQVENKKILTEEKKYIKHKIKEWESKLDKEDRHIEIMALKSCLELKVDEGTLTEDNFHEIDKIIQQRLDKLEKSKNTFLNKVKSKMSGEFKITEEDTIWDAIFKKIKQGSISDDSLLIISNKIQKMYETESYGYSEYQLREILDSLLAYEGDPTLKADLVIEKVKPRIEDTLSKVSKYVAFNGQRSESVKKILEQMKGCERITENRESHFKNFVENMLCNNEPNSAELNVFNWFLKDQIALYTIEPLKQKLQKIVAEFAEKRKSELEEIAKKKAEELAKTEAENLAMRQQAQEGRKQQNVSTSQAAQSNSILTRAKKWFSNVISRIGNFFVKLWAN